MIDFSKITSIENIKGEDSEETKILQDYFQEAKNFIQFYNWNLGIINSYFGIGVGGIFGVFLFEIKPKFAYVDKFIWVIVGDLPPAYISSKNAPNPACALDGYIGAMSEWVESAEKERSVKNLIPVNVPATPENAQKLKIRLEFLDSKILCDYQNDLNA